MKRDILRNSDYLNFSRVKRRKYNKIIWNKTSSLSSGTKAFKQKPDKMLQEDKQNL